MLVIGIIFSLPVQYCHPDRGSGVGMGNKKKCFMSKFCEVMGKVRHCQASFLVHSQVLLFSSPLAIGVNSEKKEFAPVGANSFH